MNEAVTLSGVPETMLQTAYARAKESRGRGAICNLKAEEIIDKLDYDFSLADRDTAIRSVVIARTIVLDQMVGTWLEEHPGSIVINIACGLDTRCYRTRSTSTGTILTFRKPLQFGKNSCRRMARSPRLPGPPWRTGAAPDQLLPDFRFVEEHSRVESMAAFIPIYKMLGRIPVVRNIFNKIAVLEKTRREK